MTAFEKSAPRCSSRRSSGSPSRPSAETNLLVVTGGPGRWARRPSWRAMLATFARARLGVKLAAADGSRGQAARRGDRTRGVDPAPACSSSIPRGARLQAQRGVAARRGGDHRRRGVDDRSAARRQPCCRRWRGGRGWCWWATSTSSPASAPGAVLRERHRLRCEVRTVRLSRIFRQAHQSLIVENAHRIREGEAPLSASVDTPGTDFFTVERRDPEQALRTILQLVTERIPKRFGLDPRRGRAGADADAPGRGRVDHAERCAPGGAQPDRPVHHPRRAPRCARGTR